MYTIDYRDLEGTKVQAIATFPTETSNDRPPSFYLKKLLAQFPQPMQGQQDGRIVTSVPAQVA